MSHFLRKNFPFFLSQQTSGVVYLDSAATTHKPQAVIDAMSTFYEHDYATVHRSLYQQGESSTDLFERVRKKTAQFINASAAEEIIFTKGATEGINVVSFSWGLKNLSRGDEILLTQAEHHANLLPWQWLAEQTGALLKFIPLNLTTHLLDYDDVLLSTRTKLVAVTLDSNVLGDIWVPGDLEKLTNRAHAVGAKLLIDAAQAVAHRSIDVQALQADFLVFSAHKVYGPTGLGILYMKKTVHDVMTPYQRGGSMVHHVSYHNASWAKAPHKFEAGTPPVAEVVGWGAALEFLATLDRNIILEQEHRLIAQLYAKIVEHPLIHIVGNDYVLKNRGHLLSCKVDGIHAHDLAGFLAQKQVAVRAGHHCAQPLIDELGGDALLRFSVGMYNNEHDIEIALDCLYQAITYFKKV